ncbi:MAG: ECF transporter S component [Clostridia bacterium]|nr:ECF transporter S component [Clostridia bacterium]
MKNTSTRRIVQTALFIALALVVRQFSVMIPFGGANGMRIGISEVFTKMPALVFGPVLGGAASGLVDFLAQMIKAEGAYLWPMLAVMILGGALTGVLWKIFKKLPSEKLRLGFTALCIVLLALGIFNHITLAVVKSGVWFNSLNALGDKASFTTYGLYCASVFGFVFLGADFVFKKKSENYNDDFLQLTLTVFLSDIVVTTLNTFILRFYYSGLAKIPFWTYYIPRLVQDLISTVIFAYILSCLLKVYRRITNK